MLPLCPLERPLAMNVYCKFRIELLSRPRLAFELRLSVFYRVTIQVVSNLPLTPRQKFRFIMMRIYTRFRV